MLPSWGGTPLKFKRLAHADLGRVASLQFEPVERYLEPVPEIITLVRRGVAHSLIGIEAAGALVGFYVIHPDRRDGACWWLGWLAIDWRFHGTGFGRIAMAEAMARLSRIARCRRIRLLVAPDNAAALRLYRRAGFEVADDWPDTGELVMECVQHRSLSIEGPVECLLNAYSLIQAMLLRLWRRGVPPAARMSGKFHGPPSVWSRALGTGPA